MAVLNPLKAVDAHILDDTDLAGPLLFCLLFGGFLLLVFDANLRAEKDILHMFTAWQRWDGPACALF